MDEGGGGWSGIRRARGRESVGVREREGESEVERGK